MLIFLSLILVQQCAAADYPILKVMADCPPEVGGESVLRLVADVPTYGLAKCRNGDFHFSKKNKATYVLKAVLDVLQDQNCVFQRIKGNSYMIDVEVGWGELNPLLPKSRRHTITCHYDDGGKFVQDNRTISDWFPTPVKSQKLLSMSDVNSNIRLVIMDENNVDVTWSEIPLGKPIRLRASDSPANGLSFQPLTCIAKNVDRSYTILKDGCGDGLVFDSDVGFTTVGLSVNSPLFDAFRLPGSETLQFVCNFTVCPGPCNGGSCQPAFRRKRDLGDSKPDKGHLTENDKVVVARSDEVRTRFVEPIQVETGDKLPTLDISETDISDYLNHLGSLSRDYPAHPSEAPGKNSKSWDEFLELVQTCLAVSIMVFLLFLISTFVYFTLSFRRTRTNLFVVNKN